MPLCSVRLLSLPTRDRLAAAHAPDPPERRELTVIEVVDAEGRSGFGECSALTEPGYTHEWARGAFQQLVDTGGRPEAGAPMARAGVEMALLDLDLRRAGETLAERIHASSHAGAHSLPATVPAGIVLPLAPVAETVRSAIAWTSQGVTRLKLKIVPGQILPNVTAVNAACPGVDLHVDANGSCTIDDLAELAALADHGVTAIEQPFAVDDHSSSATLAQSTSAFVLADEAATDLATVMALVGQSVATGIVIKPGRLGGIGAAIDLHDWCVGTGIGVAAGGMLECGLGRHALAALASLPGFTITGDLSPARRWLASDPFDDIVMDHGQITTPTGPGVAPPPDLALLEEFTVEQATFRRR